MVELLGNRFIMMILPTLLKSLSPMLIRELHGVVTQLKVTAAATPNPWDDILIALLEGVVSGVTMGEG